MNNSTSWPTNRYGTSWRLAVMFFHWSDEVVVENAIETLNPLKVTVRSKPIAVGSPHGDGRLSLRQLAMMMQDGDNDCIIVHPCRLPEVFGHQAGGLEDGDGWFHVIGIAYLDLADQETYDALHTALNRRRQWFGADTPFIEF